MKTILMKRLRRNGKAVRGFLSLPFKPDVIMCGTLENADYIIPDGDYPLKNTWSPRFGKLVPEIQNVPDREGIRIHMGNVPEHSTGCVLLSAYGMTTLRSFITRVEKDEEDDGQITISIRTEEQEAGQLVLPDPALD